MYLHFGSQPHLKGGYRIIPARGSSYPKPEVGKVTDPILLPGDQNEGIHPTLSRMNT